jgi:ribosomal protein S21
MIDRVYTTTPKPAHVKVKNTGMSIDIMIKIFKIKVKEDGILEEFKKRMEYIKTSKKRVEIKNSA